MDSLNKQQHLASLPSHGISLVIAGAGTGKTKTLIEKVGNIISSDLVRPEKILILTFSSKAAQEIKERVKHFIGRDADMIISGTFHSFCLGFLRNISESFLSSYGFKTFPTVIDEQKKNALQRDLLRGSMERFLGLPVDVVSGLLNGTDRLDKRTLKKLIRLGIINELNDFNRRFREYRISHNLIDFTDMMNYTIDILENNESIREQANDRFRYIMVDEFQDTSEENFKLINLILNKKEPNLFLVGDDWQSIYGFRGSRIEYLVNMKRFFKKARIYKLDVNYRSKKEIVKLSNDFIRKNRYRTSKKLKSFRGKGGHVRHFYVEGIEEEAEVIGNILKTDYQSSSGSDNIAILYRNNWQGHYLSKELGSGDLLHDSVKMMTMHSSKGLEFDNVIVAGLSDDIIPDSSSDIEEERRLLYVALTRARDKLYIVHHKSADGELSLFAKELGFSSVNRYYPVSS